MTYLILLCDSYDLQNWFKVTPPNWLLLDRIIQALSLLVQFFSRGRTEAVGSNLKLLSLLPFFLNIIVVVTHCGKFAFICDAIVTIIL